MKLRSTWVSSVLHHRLTLIILISSWGLGGCIQMEHSLRINEDASAIYSLRYAITEAAVSQFRAMRTLTRDLAVANAISPESISTDPVIEAFLDPDESTIRSLAKTLEPYGVSLDSLYTRTRPLWRDYTITLLINNIEDLQSIPFFNQFGFNLTRNSDDHYILSRSPITPNNNTQTLSPNAIENISPLLNNFSTRVSITVPGRIISTTAGRTALQTATWNYDFNQQPESVLRLLQQNFYLVFRAPLANLPDNLTGNHP